MRKLPFQLDAFEFRDLAGNHVARCVGQCQVCHSRVFTQDLVEPDPRGALGEKHSLSALRAEEFGMEGRPILLCFQCANTRETYEMGLAFAKAVWKEKVAS